MRYVFVKDLANYKKGQTVSDNLKDNTVAYIDGLTMAILLEVGVIREDRPSMVMSSTVTHSWALLLAYLTSND